MKRYSHDNWNQVLALPDGPEKNKELRVVGMLATGNLVSFVRRLLAKKEDRAYDLWRHEGKVAERSQFLDYMDRLYEDNFR